MKVEWISTSVDSSSTKDHCLSFPIPTPAVPTFSRISVIIYISHKLRHRPKTFRIRPAKSEIATNMIPRLLLRLREVNRGARYVADRRRVVSWRNVLHATAPKSQGVPLLDQLQDLEKKSALRAKVRKCFPRNTNGKGKSIYHIAGRHQNVPFEAAANSASKLVLLEAGDPVGRSSVNGG